MSDNNFGYSTGYPGFAGQPANQGYQTYSQPPPSFSQNQPGNYGGSQYSQGKDNGSQYGRQGSGGNYGSRGSGYDSGGDRGPGSGRSGGGNYNSGTGRGGYDKAMNDSRSGDFITQEDTIFISGMDPRTSEADIKQHFGAIGLIKNDKKSGKPKIWIYVDKETGRSKGEATVTFDDPHTASAAIEWFNGKDFNGCTISVQLASRKDTWQGGRGGGGRGGRGGRGGGRGGHREDREDRGGYDSGGGGYRGNDDYGRGGDYGKSDGGGYRSEGGGRGGGFRGGNRDGGRGGERGGRGGFGREGDWKCPNPDCVNTNFSWRQQCNRCNEEKPADAGSSGGDSDRRGGSSGGRGRGFGGGRGGGGRGGRGPGGGGRGGGPMKDDYGNQRNRPY